MIKTVGPRLGRAFHFDFHTSPGIENILKNFDAEHFAAQLATAHIEYVNVAARCNMGYSYYNTRVGKKYPGLGDRDVLDEMLRACHKRGIGVTAYFNVGLDHEIAADNPGWLKAGKDGRIYLDDKKDNFFRIMCYNSPYRAHFLAEIREVCRYDIDGLFCDCFQLRECFCPTCMADMAKRRVDVDDNAAVLDYQNKIRLEFAKEIYDAAGDKKDGIKFYFNGLSWTVGRQTHAEIECLSSDPQWGYDYFDSMAAYTRTMYEDRIYMSGRFQNSWGDFGGVKPIASMQNDLYDAMMNSFGISYGDHMHPVDGFENEVVARVKQVMEEKLAYEPYTKDSENIVEVGVIIHSNDVTRRLPYFAKGAARMLKELKIQYNVYDENGSFENDGVKLLIISEMADYGEAFKARVRDFCARGGRVIFVGAAIDLGCELGLLDFVELVGKDTRDNAYYTVTGSDMRWAMYDPSRVIKNRGGTEIAKYVSNIVNFTWDGRQSCYYRPQGEPTAYSAAIIKNNAACICFDLCKAYADNFLVEHRELMKKLIDALLPERLIDAPQMPKTATVALTKTAAHTVLHVKATYPEHKMSRGIIEEHTYMKSVPVSLNSQYEVYVLPEMKKLPSRTENGRTVFETGDLLGYRAFLLK
ncbi:MAG: hypothetical protein E7639_05485 [Ruminococcaceae bacterium]|nr:hypothetical protein [Oscillospiraceae bacterium]